MRFTRRRVEQTFIKLIDASLAIIATLFAMTILPPWIGSLFGVPLGIATGFIWAIGVLMTIWVLLRWLL